MHYFYLLVITLAFPISSDASNTTTTRRICLRNLMINGTQLVDYRNQPIFVLGISHLGCQACRNQAVRYNDLYRDLNYQRINEAEVRLALINDANAEQYLPGSYYGKVRVFQDNWKDRVVDKLGHHGERLNNLVFDRCGYLVYTQRYPHSNIEDEHNYQQLLLITRSLVRNKQLCSSPCR